MATIIFKFALFLLNAFLALPSECCQTYIKFGNSYNGCAFHVTYNDTACHNFIWSHCSFENEDDQLVNQASFSACTRQCCDQEVVYAQNWDGIRQCQDYLDWKGYVIIIIFVSIFVGGPIICCINGLIYVVFMACKNCCCPEQRAEAAPQSNHRQNIDVSSLEIPQPQIVHVQTRATQKATKSQKLRETCCICLQKGISLELECGHVFHRKCITAWFRKKSACALCRSQELDTVIVYCEGCFSSFKNTTLLENLDSLEFNRQLCQKCR